MTLETLDVQGFMPALHGMRNPMNSWNKSDSHWLYHDDDSKLKYEIGENDKELSIRLQKAGPEHCKHLRQIVVWVDINAPLYWWKEMDTYRMGVEKNSCSTMHKLTSRPLDDSDFEIDCVNEDYTHYVLDCLNTSMEAWKYEKDIDVKNEIWRSIIQGLPESYLQKRTVMMSYAALRNIVRQREGHKLKEWAMFIDWAKSLPESWMIFE